MGICPISYPAWQKSMQWKSSSAQTPGALTRKLSVPGSQYGEATLPRS